MKKMSNAAARQAAPAKYNFGLLETPGSSSAVQSEGECKSAWSVPDQKCCLPVRSTRRAVSSTSSSLAVQTPRGPNLGLFKTPVSRTSKTPQKGFSCHSKTPGSLRVLHTGSCAMTPGHSDRKSAFCTALVEGRGLARGEIGMASIDLKRPVLILSQFPDSQTYVKVMTKLQIYQPVEVIMPNTACENDKMSTLFQLVSDQYQNTNIATVQRKYFNESKGLQYIQQLCLPEKKTVEMEVATKYYCLAAAAALLKYVEFIQNIIYAPKSLNVVFKGSEQTAMIDVVTARNLELLVNLRDPHSQHNLFGVLNYTKTPGGSRLLRSNILEPPCSVETIKTRQIAVAEMTEDEDLFFKLQEVIARFIDVDHLLSQCVQIPKSDTVKTAETKITNVILLKHTLALIEPLKAVLETSTNDLFKAYHESLADPRFALILEKINGVINEETQYQKGALNMRTQKCFAVKPKINGLLDVARRTYTEIVDDIATLVQQLAEVHNLPLKMAYNSSRGFHIQLLSTSKVAFTLKDLPPGFIKPIKAKNVISCITADLIKLNDRTKASLQEIYLMTNIVISELMKEIVEHIGCLYQLTECVSMIDMLVAFAHNCTLSEYVRPDLTDTLAIKQGRHPILDKITCDPPVPNNTYASEETNFVIITGPNMSGKSTYLRQVVLLQIMAQIGSFVPAEYASFRVANQIFSRIGSDDDMENNSSTFMVEMREINYIVRNATATSLVIIDELGRGTSAEEGVGLCFAICEHLLGLKAFSFLATHFMELTNLQALYPNVENYYFQIQHMRCPEEDRIQKVFYTHVLAKGKMSEKYYGIQLAEVSTLPKSVVDNARRMTEKLAHNREGSHETSKEERKKRSIYKCAMKLTQTARNSRLDKESLRLYLISLRRQCMEELFSTTDEEL